MKIYRLAVLGLAAALLWLIPTPSDAQCSGTTAANKFCAGPPSGGVGQFRPRAMVPADLLIGSATQAWDADLDCIAAISSAGIITRTGAGTCAARNVTGTANEIAVTNPAGTAGNIILSLPAALTYTGKTITGGSFTGGAFTGAAWDNGAIGGTTPAAGRFTDLETTQTIKLGGVITPAQITADQNNYSPTGFATATILRLDTNATRSITGIVAGVEGRVIVIQNVGASDLKLLNENSASTAANRFAIFADAVLNPNTSTALRYDATSQRWRSLAGANAGSGGGGGVSQVIIAAGTGINVSGTCTITSIGTCTINLNTPVDAANGGTGVASPTANTIPVNAGASPQTRVAMAAGQNLGANASGVPIATDGGWRLLNTMTANNTAASLDDTSTFSTWGSIYNDFEIVLENLIPATNSVCISLQVRSGGTFQTTTYLSNVALGSGSVTASNALTTGNMIGSCGNNIINTAASGGVSGRGMLAGPVTGTSSPKIWTGHFAHEAANAPGQWLTIVASGRWGSNAALDGFRIISSSGNLLSGVVKVYGRK